MGERETLVAGALDGYDPEVGAALWRLEEARERTLRLFERMPDRFVDRDVRGNTIGTILYHVALIEADWLYTEILEEPVPEDLERLFPVDDRDHEGVLTAVRGESLEQHLDRLRSTRQRLLEELRGMTAEDFHRPRPLPNYDVTPAWVLHHLAQHEAEHRSEIGSAVESLRE